MKLNILSEVNNNGKWDAHWHNISLCEHRMKSNELCEILSPYLIITPKQYLLEMTYKEIAAGIDPNFLRNRVRAAALRGVYYKGFTNNDTMEFMIPASLEHRPYGETVDKQIVPEYTDLIKFMAWDDVGSDPNLTPREKSLMLLWTSDIKVSCNCPAFLYWGAQYILTQLDAAINPETRPPQIRNPTLAGCTCKHLTKVLSVLPFYTGDISKVITDQWGGKISQRDMDAIRRRNDAWNKANTNPTEISSPEEI